MIEEALRRQLADDQLTDVLAVVRERSDLTDEPSHPKNTVRRRGASRHEGRLRAREFSLYGIQRMESPSLLYERAPALRRKRLPRMVSVVLHRSAPHTFGFVRARTEGSGVLETGEGTVRITFWQDLVRPCRDLSCSVEPAYEISTDQTPAARQLDFEVAVHETDVHLDTTPDSPIHEIFAALVEDTARTEAICRDVTEAAARGRRCLVLTERKDHLDALTAGLTALGNEPAVLAGGVGKKARQRVIDQAASLEPGEGFVIVATGRYIDEGFDCPPLDTLFLTFPVSFRGIVVQYTGRLLSTTADKKVVRVHDYADRNVPMLARMLDKRLRNRDEERFGDARRQVAQYAKRHSTCPGLRHPPLDDPSTVPIVAQ